MDGPIIRSNNGEARMILQTHPVFYSDDQATELAIMLQKNDPDWQYIKRNFDIEYNKQAFIEVLDVEGVHLGYL